MASSAAAWPTTWRGRAGAIERAPLYRPEDGHYQFKYLPVFAVLMAPVAYPSRAVASVTWYALVVVGLVALLGTSDSWRALRTGIVAVTVIGAELVSYRLNVWSEMFDFPWPFFT